MAKKFDENSRIRDVLNDPRAVDIIIKNFGGDVLKHPLLPIAKMFTIKKAISYKDKVGVPEEKIASVLDEILNLE